MSQMVMARVEYYRRGTLPKHDLRPSCWEVKSLAVMVSLRSEQGLMAVFDLGCLRIFRFIGVPRKYLQSHLYCSFDVGLDGGRECAFAEDMKIKRLKNVLVNSCRALAPYGR